MPKVLPSLDLPLLGLEPSQLVWVPGVLFADPSVSLTHMFCFFLCVCVCVILMIVFLRPQSV